MYRENEPDSLADQRYRNVLNFIASKDAGCGFNEIKNTKGIEMHHDTLKKILDTMEESEIITIDKSDPKKWIIKLADYNRMAEANREIILAIIDQEIAIYPKINRYAQVESITHILHLLGIVKMLQFWDYMCGRKFLEKTSHLLLLDKIDELANLMQKSASGLPQKTKDQMDKRLQTELQCATYFLLAKGEQGLMHAVSSNRKGYRTKDEFLRDIDSVYDHEFAIEQSNEMSKIYAKEKKLPDLQASFRDFADKDSKQYKKFTQRQKQLGQCEVDLKPHLIDALNKFFNDTSHEEQLKYAETLQDTTLKKYILAAIEAAKK